MVLLTTLGLSEAMHAGTSIPHAHDAQSCAGCARAASELRQTHQRLEELLVEHAWTLPKPRASPRANHALRTVPPFDIAAGNAQAHDDAVWQILQACLGGAASGEVDGPWRLSQHRKAGWRGLMHSLALASAPWL